MPYDALPEPVRLVMDKPFTGDFDTLVERRAIRVGVTFNRSHEASQAFKFVRLSVHADQDQMTGEDPMRCTRTVTPLHATVALVALCSAMVLAQDKVQPSFAESQKANAQALRQYSWKSRTEIKLKGESKNVKLEQVRYDANGKLQKTPIGAPPAAAPPPPQGGRGGRLKAKVIENKKEEFGELMQGLGQLVASYGQLPPDKLQAFKATATTGRGEGALQATAQIQGFNVLEQGDSMTIWIDPVSQMMRRVEIKTIYDKKPATLVADYQSVPNGPTYMARAVLTYPEKNVELTVDNSDYVKGQP